MSSLNQQQQPQPPSKKNSPQAKKPLLSADTLYDPVIYSAHSIDAPPPYLQRLEYDRTNPVDLPKSLSNKEITIVTHPTRYPLLHNYTILCPDQDTVDTIRHSIPQQINQQLSPLYLLYRSLDRNPRVVTKDQIPSIIDDTSPHDRQHLPHPVISLNIPMVTNTIQNPMPLPHEAVVSTLIASAATYGYKTFSEQRMWRRYFSQLNSNHASASRSALSFLSAMTSHHTVRNITGSSLLQTFSLWGGFFGLRHFFFIQNSYRKIPLN